MNKSQADIDWLGKDDAHLAPAARAALGILVAADEWAWWDDPSLAGSTLQRVVPSSGLARWGGNSSVAEAAQWVDALRAVAIANAFKSLERQRIRIKILRPVWTWPAGISGIEALSNELTTLLGPGSVFPEWKTSSKPRFPYVEVQEGQRLMASPNLPAKAFEPIVSQHLTWSPGASIADIVVADSVESLRKLTAAHVVILYGPQSNELLNEISPLRVSLSAQCVIKVDADTTQIAAWLRIFIAEWERLRQSFIGAMEVACAQSGVNALILSSTQKFLLNKKWFHEPPLLQSHAARSAGPGIEVYEVVDIDLQNASQEVDQAAASQDSFARYIDTAKVIGIDSGTVSRPTISPVESPVSLLPRDTGEPKVLRPSPPMERVLDATVRQGTRTLTKWPTAGQVEIDLSICTRSPLHGKRHTFPADRIEWLGNEKSLQVHLFELGKAPVSKELILPKTGDSAAITFTGKANDRQIDLRFIVSDGARILQTARLQSTPGGDIHFFIENIVTPVHRAKEGFDVALLVNDSLGGKPSLTVISADGQVVLSPLFGTETEAARNELLRVLQRAVTNPTESLAPLLMELASLGATLLQELRERVPTWPKADGRIQLVTQNNAFFPIEYLYDGVLPESNRASLCSKREGCLKSGKEIPLCPIRAAQKELCPMGFVGVSGLVERHTWQAGAEAALWAAPRGLEPQRMRINDLSQIAFAASDLADEFDDEDVKPHEPVRIADIVTSLGVPRIPTWKDWKTRIAATNPPSMLVLIVHMEQAAVHIESTSGVPVGALSARYVGNAPVTIAIGCSTGLGQVPGGSLPAVLRRCGARVVIAAMTDVLGRHANRAARELALRLRDAAKSTEPTRVGQIVSELRRGLLNDGLALGLAIVAFGDADVLLGG